MGLIAPFTSSFGTTHSQAYHKISILNIDYMAGKTMPEIQCRMEIWPDKASRDSGFNSMQSREYVVQYPITDQNFFSASYDAIVATDPYFSGSIKG
jgi:hypothetical protein|tara:strand:- start:88 stop:375 length:288 start_codon:yes stop_codon:yes gene_type:complete